MGALDRVLAAVTVVGGIGEEVRAQLVTPGIERQVVIGWTAIGRGLAAANTRNVCGPDGPCSAHEAGAPAGPCGLPPST